MIQLGDEVKDRVTGFKGIAICRCDWLHGCIRFVVQPSGVTKDGKVFENHTFDENSLEVIKPLKVKDTPKTPGGDRVNIQRGATIK